MLVSLFRKIAVVSTNKVMIPVISSKVYNTMKHVIGKELKKAGVSLTSTKLIIFL